MFNGAKCVTSAKTKYSYIRMMRDRDILHCSSPTMRLKAIDAISLITQLWLFCAQQNMGLTFTKIPWEGCVKADCLASWLAWPNRQKYLWLPILCFVISLGFQCHVTTELLSSWWRLGKIKLPSRTPSFCPKISEFLKWISYTVACTPWPHNISQWSNG